MGKRAKAVTVRWSVASMAVGWKVAVALVVPLAVIAVLGVLTVSQRLRDVGEYTGTERYIDIIGVLNRFTTDTTALSIAQGAGVVTDDLIANLRGSLARAESAGAGDDVPGGRVNYQQMLDTGRTALAEGTKRTESLEVLRARMETLRRTATIVQGQVITKVSDQDAASARARLVDASNGSASLIQETLAALAITRGERDGLAKLLAATNGERALIVALSAHYPDGEPAIAQLNQEADARLRMAAAPGQFPIFQVASSFQLSAQHYRTIIDGAIAFITNTVHGRADDAQRSALINVLTAVVMMVTTLLVAIVIARSLIVPLRRLRTAAQRVADEDLPAEVERIRDGARLEDVRPSEMPVRTREEVGQLGRAIDSMHQQALRIAGEQAQLRMQVNDMFDTLARRNKRLLDDQLALLERAKTEEHDRAALARLFRLDHMAARMRRNSVNLLILSGGQSPAGRQAPVDISVVLREATSEVEEYRRVSIRTPPARSVVGPAAADVGHIFAELFDNALRASPPESTVVVTFAHANDGGALVEVADRGIGIPAEEIGAINSRLRKEPAVSAQTARHMGLFVVAKLAYQHQMTVTLHPTVQIARDPGVTALVHLPRHLLTAENRRTRESPGDSEPPAEQTQPQPPLSGWLANPVPGRVRGNYSSEADAGWRAVQRARELVLQPTAVGLPQRNPGDRLIPGGTRRGGQPPLRDPEAVSQTLAHHQQGVQRGRSAGAGSGRRNQDSEPQDR